jgi:hypothetical protein
MLYILSCLLCSLLVRFLFSVICTLLWVAHAPGVTLLPFLYSLLQSSFPSVHVLTLLSSLSCTYIETYENRYLLLFLVLVLSLSLFCRLPASLLSRCSGSDDTSPSSSLLSLPHCECILSLLCCCLLALCLGAEYLFPPREATPSVSSSASDGIL